MKSKLPGVKLGTFNGEGAVEEFLSRFDVMAGELGWSDHDQLVQLRLALVAPASRLLNTLALNATSLDLRRLLLAKYGSEVRRVQYEALLESRVQQPNESFSQVADDIDHLLSMSQPHLIGPAREAVAIKYFLKALPPPLALTVKGSYPTTLQEAVGKCIQREVWEAECRTASAAWGITPPPLSSTRSEKTKTPESGQSEDALASLVRSLSSLGAREATPTTTGTSKGGTFQSPDERVKPSPETHPCRYCKQMGHWRRECPVRLAREKAKHTTTAGADTAASPAGQQDTGTASGGAATSTAKVGMMSTQAPHSCSVSVGLPTSTLPAVYLVVQFQGTAVPALLDTGCERSVVGSCLLKEAEVVPTNMTLTAANGTPIPLKGETRTSLSVGTDVLPAHLLVTEHLADLILGY